MADQYPDPAQPESPDHAQAGSPQPTTGGGPPLPPPTTDDGGGGNGWIIACGVVLALILAGMAIAVIHQGDDGKQASAAPATTVDATQTIKNQVTVQVKPPSPTTSPATTVTQTVVVTPTVTTPAPRTTTAPAQTTTAP
ncbi:MAG TPA: hypothetical protein VGO71_18140 [Baekduia sp.]|nr:hypothetical protein [Baekduia sp.]